MHTLENILERKGREVYVTGPTQTVREAAMAMRRHGCGGLVVTQDGQPGTPAVGIITERDVLHKVVALNLDPDKVQVREVMTADMVCCTPDTSIDEARQICMQQRIRRLPIIGQHGQVVGMVSLGDLNAWALSGQSIEIHYLREYIYGQAV